VRVTCLDINRVSDSEPAAARADDGGLKMSHQLLIVLFALLSNGCLCAIVEFSYPRNAPHARWREEHPVFGAAHRDADSAGR
jgi:hypothetical protein